MELQAPQSVMHPCPLIKLKSTLFSTKDYRDQAQPKQRAGHCWLVMDGSREMGKGPYNKDLYYNKDRNRFFNRPCSDTVLN